jgi:tRNA pseudouridine55 synthase
MEFQFETGEVLLVNKPCSWTSFDVVGKMRNVIRKKTGIRKIKIGHAGTLDPLASGLLILCTGRFTKKIDEYQGLEKEYTGTFRLGATTASFDLETEVDHTFPLGDLTASRLHEAAQHFTGTFDQVPPMFSAKKIDGTRAYEHARKDRFVEIKPNHITISAFELTNFHLPEVDFRIVCSKGTYIRSLARDFGQHLGCGAHLTALCRTRIGPYCLRDAYEIEDLSRKIAESGIPS